MADYFLTLHPEDVIYCFIFPRLSIKDCFNLRCLSRTYKNLVDHYFKLLKCLNLSYFKFFPSQSFEVFISNCSHLDTIEFCSCIWLTNELAVPLFKKNVNIRYLDLSFCPKLTAACLQPVIISCKNLRELKLNGNLWLTNGCLEALIFHHTNVQYLNLSNCSQISNREIIYSLLNKFSKLQTLDLSNTNLIDSNLRHYISEIYPQLQLISLHGNSN